MSRFLGVILGFIATFLVYTLFANFASLAMAALYALALYFLFYAKPHIWGWPFYLGITAGAELLGSARFGVATIFAYGTFILLMLFKERLRFTSLELRFSTALALNLGAYALLAGFIAAPLASWLSLGIIFLLFSGFILLRPNLIREDSYEPL